MRLLQPLSRLAALKVALLILIVPLLVLFAFGIFSLIERGCFFIWLIATALLYWGSWKFLQKRFAPPIVSNTEREKVSHLSPESFWDEQDLETWKKIQDIASEVEQSEWRKDPLQEVTDLSQRLGELVSTSYHPKSSYPLLEARFSHVLLAAQLASRDLRELFVEQIPFESLLTINEALTAKRNIEWMNSAYQLYRVARPFANPASALVQEIRGLLAKRAIRDVAHNSSRWLLARVIEGAGKHLINLYSGKLVDPQDIMEWSKDNVPSSLTSSEMQEVQQEERWRSLKRSMKRGGRFVVESAVRGATKAISKSPSNFVQRLRRKMKS